MNHAVNSKLLKTLDCYHLPAKMRYCLPGFEAYYNAAYHFWREMICEGLLSEGLVEQAKTLSSDEFVNQDDFVCLFLQTKPIGLFMFSWMNLAYPANKDRRYITVNYPATVIETLLRLGHEKLMTMGHLTIHPEWRKSRMGPGVGEILVGLAVKRFLTSRASALLSFSRNNRKTQDLAYHWGAQPLLKNYQAYGIDSDILAIYRDTVMPTIIEGIPELVEYLWLNKHNAVLTPSLYTSLKEHPDFAY